MIFTASQEGDLGIDEAAIQKMMIIKKQHGCFLNYPAFRFDRKLEIITIGIEYTVKINISRGAR